MGKPSMWGQRSAEGLQPAVWNVRLCMCVCVHMLYVCVHLIGFYPSIYTIHLSKYQHCLICHWTAAVVRCSRILAFAIKDQMWKGLDCNNITLQEIISHCIKGEKEMFEYLTAGTWGKEFNFFKLKKEINMKYLSSLSSSGFMSAYWIDQPTDTETLGFLSSSFLSHLEE